MDEPQLPTASPGQQTLSQPDGSTPEVNFAFLVHSQDSLGQKSPPSIDDQRLVRQKRKRTSPEDHAILEAEYECNPKPDKASRLAIVNRVALGEKEVQIWFQNRRQLTRRKSRPSETREIQLEPTSSLAETSVNSSFAAPKSSALEPFSASSQSSFSMSQDCTGSTNAASKNSESLSSPDDQPSQRAVDTLNDEQSVGLCQTFKMDSSGTMRPRKPADRFKSLPPSPRRPGYLANRRSAPFIIHEDGVPLHSELSVNEYRQSKSLLSDSAPSKDLQPIQKTSSLVKLSLDAEGKAEVKRRTGETPSPAKAPAFDAASSSTRRSPGLRRSYSAIEPGRLGESAVLPSRLNFQRKPLGRSRDARTWEFYCDSSARDELTKQAAREESGSAAAAIGIIRSQSGSQRALTPNLSKKNGKLEKGETTKTHKSAGMKPGRAKLERAYSSVARLQTTGINRVGQQQTQRPAEFAKGKAPVDGGDDFAGDSDKENWQPGTQSRPPRRRPVQAQTSRRFLLESRNQPPESTSIGAVVGKGEFEQRLKRLKASAKENAAPEIDEEVATFMGNDILSREEEDLDCVQNLLSLSQAAWV